MGEVGQGLRRNISMVISVILVTAVSLSFVGTAALLQLQINRMKSYWYDRAQVAVYLCTEFDTSDTCQGADVTDEQRQTIEGILKSDTLAPLVDQVFFVDHQEAYTEFQQQFAGTDIAGTASPEQLNETYWVRLKDPSQSAAIAESLAGVAGVQSVVDQRSLLDRIFAVLNAASYAAIGIAVLMLVAAMLLISTTIRLSAFSRRREIAIMRLVGASNTFIQTPFILEGIFSAFVGSLIAGGVSLAVVKFFVQDYLVHAVPFTSYISLQDVWAVPPILAIVGVALAAVSAKIAITRYLKV